MQQNYETTLPENAAELADVRPNIENDRQLGPMSRPKNMSKNAELSVNAIFLYDKTAPSIEGNIQKKQLFVFFVFAHGTSHRAFVMSIRNKAKAYLPENNSSFPEYVKSQEESSINLDGEYQSKALELTEGVFKQIDHIIKEEKQSFDVKIFCIGDGNIGYSGEPYFLKGFYPFLLTQYEALEVSAKSMQIIGFSAGDAKDVVSPLNTRLKNFFGPFLGKENVGVYANMEALQKYFRDVVPLLESFLSSNKNEKRCIDLQPNHFNILKEEIHQEKARVDTEQRTLIHVSHKEASNAVKALINNEFKGDVISNTFSYTSSEQQATEKHGAGTIFSGIEQKHGQSQEAPQNIGTLGMYSSNIPVNEDVEITSQQKPLHHQSFLFKKAPLIAPFSLGSQKEYQPDYGKNRPDLKEAGLIPGDMNSGESSSKVVVGDEHPFTSKTPLIPIGRKVSTKGYLDLPASLNKDLDNLTLNDNYDAKESLRVGTVRSDSHYNQASEFTSPPLQITKTTSMGPTINKTPFLSPLKLGKIAPFQLQGRMKDMEDMEDIEDNDYNLNNI